MKSYYSFLFVVFVAVAAATRLPLLRRRGGALKAPYLPKDTPLPEAQWIEQQLDHFLAPDNKPSTWQQRYFVNSTWWDKDSGPVFLLLGGEGPASPNWIVADTHIMINAQKYKALVFSIEHRFYGESQPTEDVSMGSLKYLSSQQALADFANFRHQMVTKYKLTSKNKWICFGGSYSGALSAWLRQVYPDAVVGAVATSAPVLAKLNFVEYVEVVEQSLSTKGESCPANVAIASADLYTMLKDTHTRPEVEKMFKVNPPLESDKDVVNLLDSLSGNFEGIVQYNRDNTAFEGRPNNITIELLCDMMTNDSLGAPLQRYAAINALMMGNDTDLDVSYLGMVQDMRNSSWKADAVKSGERQWTYQTCTEFGYFQTTESKKTSLFAQGIDLEFFIDMCKDVFGITPEDVYAIENRTNQFYGGRNVTGTNIVFPNGSIDPWHALSVLTDIGSTVHARLITGTAHCANMYPPRDSDLPDLTAARQEISTLIGQWLGTL